MNVTATHALSTMANARGAFLRLNADHRENVSGCRRAASPVGTRCLLVAALLALLVVLHGCSGDSRPLTEAVEVEELGIESLQIRPPERSIETSPGFSVGVGQQVQFTLVPNGGEGDVELPNRDRNWTVSDSAIASISSGGLLEGLSAGTTQINVGIGGIAAESYEVTVSAASLSVLDEVIGEAELEPCLADSYFAAGTFEDGTRRLLPDVSWSLGTPVDAELIAQDDGGVRVSAREPGALTLRATVADAAPFDETVTVLGTLASIAIEPDTDPLNVEVDASLELIARGQYARGEGDDTSAADITDNVDWSITTGEESATVGNESASDKGLLSGRAVGSATVQVACGVAVTAASRAVSVSEASTDGTGANGLVFDGPNPLILSVGDSTRLSVSTGTAFSETNEVSSSDVTYTVDNPNVATLSAEVVDDGFGAPGGTEVLTTGGFDPIPGGAGITAGGTIGDGTVTSAGPVIGDGIPTGGVPIDDGTSGNNVITGRSVGTTTLTAELLSDGSSVSIEVQVVQ